ncbi:MAG: Gfo/Idh/MocA family oxidoreductase [Clostridia bacterium]|nr:Gfo/Idh/MocA family oxidoreductase [Clostridia bacterium]
MDKIRLGVVGLGHRGRQMFHLSGISFDYVIPVAACDLFSRNWYKKQWLMDKPMAEYFPETEFYDSYDEMLEKAGLDAVLVETGADVHANFCVKALEHNVNVLTDIPVVANLEEADILWKAAQKSKAIISVGANPNEQKFACMLKDFYESGKLGKPYYMEAEYIHWSLPNSEFHKGITENGDWRKLLCPIRYCTHSLGPLLAILDEDLKEVSCFGTGQHADSSEYEEGNKKDDMSCAQFRTDSGVVVRLLRNGRCRAAIGNHNYRVFGTEGYMERIDRLDKPTIRFNSMKDNPELQEISGEFMPPAYADNPNAVGHGGMDYAILDKFFNALKNGLPAPISLKEGLAMTLPGIYAEESSKRGGEIVKMLYPWDNDWSTNIK